MHKVLHAFTNPFAFRQALPDVWAGFQLNLGSLPIGCIRKVQLVKVWFATLPIRRVFDQSQRLALAVFGQFERASLYDLNGLL